MKQTLTPAQQLDAVDHELQHLRTLAEHPIDWNTADWARHAEMFNSLRRQRLALVQQLADQERVDTDGYKNPVH